MIKEKILEYYNSRSGAISGAIIGLIIALVVLTLGPIKAIFLVICVSVGYYVGKRLSEDQNYLTNLLDRILPPGTYR